MVTAFFLNGQSLNDLIRSAYPRIVKSCMYLRYIWYDHNMERLYIQSTHLNNTKAQQKSVRVPTTDKLFAFGSNNLPPHTYMNNDGMAAKEKKGHSSTDY